ncbi:hypothetical protein A7W90_00365 [Clostridium sp. Bc-iso-3]|nr:hypothetical protein A7W90_00365 [Clostridium sp. Bc-iso-3]
MKRIITTVGVSLIRNYLDYYVDYLSKELNGHCEDISGKYKRVVDDEEAGYDCREYLKSNHPHVRDIKSNLKKWIKDVKCVNWHDRDKRNVEKNELPNHINEQASAEIKSIIKFVKRHKDDVIVNLIATDSILSCIAAEAIKETLDSYEIDGNTIRVEFNFDNDSIKGLQVRDHGKFKQYGIANLLNRCNKIAPEGSTEVYLNVTGGYKGVIPIMTLIGQVYNYKVIYIYEETETIVTLPNIPLKFDYEWFEKDFEVFNEISNGAEIDKIEKISEGFFDKKEYKDYEFIFERVDNVIDFTDAGTVLWKRFMQDKSIYYIPEDVWEQINKDEGILTFLKSKKESTNVEPENSHKTVWKHCRNTERIYYFIDGKKTFIYKVFSDHNAHDKYIREVKFNDELKEKIINTAKARLIKNN